MAYFNMGDIWFEQDGSTSHFAFETTTTTRWWSFSRIVYVTWTPRPWNLTPLEYFLWSYVKNQIFHRAVVWTHDMIVSIMKFTTGHSL